MKKSMKKSLCMIMALIMFLCVAPISVSAATYSASNVRIEGAVNGVVDAGGTDETKVKVEWDMPENLVAGQYKGVLITRSFDKVNWETVKEVTSVGSGFPKGWNYTVDFDESMIGKTFYISIQLSVEIVNNVRQYGPRATASAKLINSPGKPSQGTFIAYPGADTNNAKAYYTTVINALWKEVNSGGATVEYKNCTNGNIKVGSQAIYDNALYKVTVTVKALDSSKITFTEKVESKVINTELFSVTSNNYSKTATRAFGYLLNGICDFVTNIRMNYGLYRDEFVKKADSAGLSADLIDKAYKIYDYVNGESGADYEWYFVNPYTSVTLDTTKLTASKSAIGLGNAFVQEKSAVNKINITSNGTTVYYKQSSAKSWKSKKFAGGKAMSIKGLKPDTKYNVKCKYYVNAENYGETVNAAGDYNKTYTFCTAPSKAPKVKSVKISKVKIKKHHQEAGWRKGVDGYYWVDEDNWKTRSYKVTVTLSKKSKNTKGIVVKTNDYWNPTKYIKGNKKKYTFTVTEHSKNMKFSKKRTIKVATYSNPLDTASAFTRAYGVSPYAKKNVKINKIK